jgi:caffeoyl-CoA O-methyltransferase
MKFIDPAIEEYCIDKSTKPDGVCEEIQKYTLENEHWSVMLTGPMEGSFIGFLLRLNNSKRVLEFGTFTGYSALAMAQNLPEDGEVITFDKDVRLHKLSREFWDKSAHGKNITGICGNAVEEMEKLEGEFDFVFIDADKVNYKNYLDFSLSRLSEKGMIAIDNVLWSGRVVTDEDQEKSTIALREINDYLAGRDDLYVTLAPIRDGLFLVQRK